MNLKTNFDYNKSVWVLNPKSGEAVQRTIKAIRSQVLFGNSNTIYGFLKDWSINKESPTVDDLFWLSEDKVHSSKSDLINSL